MNIWYFCANPNISLNSAQYAPSIHIRATIEGFQTLGHQVQHFLYADELGQIERQIRKSTRKFGRTSILLQKTKPLLRDVYELYQNIARDKSVILPVFRDNSIDLVYERLFPSKSAISACAVKYKVPIIVESNAPASERKQYWGSPLYILINQLEKKILQRADAVTVVSTPLKSYYEKLGIPSQKIFVLPNGVNKEKFSPHNASPNVRMNLNLGDKVVVGFIGNIHPYHGAELFLALGHTLNLAKENLHFLIVGGGPGRDELQAALVRENLDMFFTLVGPVPHDKVPDYIAAMDICLLPRFMWYGSPMKVLEYGAMGKAIIAPDLENIRDVLHHAETAFLFEPEDGFALARAIQELSHNPQLRSQLGECARKHILTNHTWTKNAERIVEVYRQIVSANIT